MKKRQHLTIFTDGSCYARHPEKLGGSGVFITWDETGKEYFISRGFKNTKIGRRELEAFLFALRAINTKIPITATLYSDSQYVVNTAKNHLFDWQTGKEILLENKDLWDQVSKEISLRPKLKIKLIWIPGHQKDYNNPTTIGNYIADVLADYKNHKEYKLDIRNNS